MTQAPPIEDEPILALRLAPHRSLAPAAARKLMAASFTVTAAFSLPFYLIGAWPIVGFLGLDVALLYLAFRASYRSARLYETVKLTEDALVVERIGPGRRRARWSFQPYWLRVELDDPPQHHSQLRLTSHGRSLVLGAFLSPGERFEFAAALSQALRRQRDTARGAASASAAQAPQPG